MKPIPFNALAQKINRHHSCCDLVTGVSIDSRKVEKGDLFFAMKGNKVDGHDFIAEVAARGAIGLVVSETYQGEGCGLPMLRVSNVLNALQELARNALKERRSKVIAITGSLGKTSVKGFAETLIGAHYPIFASPLSYNSQATLPLCILMADGDEEYLILEMGMSGVGEIANLISIAPPHIALLTTIAIQHALNFSDGISGIAREKASIFLSPSTTLGLLPPDVHNFEEVAKTGSCPKKCFSLSSKESDFFLEIREGEVRIWERGVAHEIKITLPAKVHYHNFLAAVALARCVDVPWDCIAEAAHQIRLPPMRFERVSRKGILFINDAYNAIPDSMKVALENLPKPERGGKTIAVLSEMDALGMYSEEGHASVAQTALQYVDLLLCVGSRCEAMRKIWQQQGRPVELFDSRSLLEEALSKHVKPGDVVLLKGARAYALENVLKKF